MDRSPLSSYPVTLPIDVGTRISLEAVPAEGYHFANWDGDLTGSDETTNIRVMLDRVITAHFEPDADKLASEYEVISIVPEETVVLPPPPAPAVFTSSSLEISPLEVSAGEPVRISALVANTGEEEGSYDVILKINGVVAETEEVTLAGGASRTVTFTTSGDEADTYSVDVNGIPGLFIVREAALASASTPPAQSIGSEGVNWSIFMPVMIVVVFLAIFLPIRLRRRRVFG